MSATETPGASSLRYVPASSGGKATRRARLPSTSSTVAVTPPHSPSTVVSAGGCPMVSWLQSYLYCAILPLPLYRPHVERVTRFQAEGLGRGLYGVGHGMATLTSLTGRQLDGSFHE